MGFPWIRSKDVKAKIRMANRDHMTAWRELQECYKNGKLAMLVQPKASFSWDMPLAREVGSYTDSRFAEFCLGCAGGAYQVDMTLLTNSDEVFTAFNLGPCAGCHAPVLLELLETQPEEHSYEDLFWPFSFVQRFGDAVRTDYQKRYPEDYCERVTESDFVQRALSGSTKRLQRASVMAEVTAEIQAWSARMVPGDEIAHLKELVATTELRGSEAELLTSTPFRELRQRVPYPAYRWQWQTRDVWRWKHEQHINVLEVQAFLQHLRSRVSYTMDSGSSTCWTQQWRLVCSPRVVRRARDSIGCVSEWQLGFWPPINTLYTFGLSARGASRTRSHECTELK
jgi:hypothetical protein